MIVATNIDEKTLKRDGVCAASLPTTMGIVAGFLVQNTLKYLLKFGQVTKYLGYSALHDFFPTMQMKPNESCDDSFCVQRQKEYQKRKAEEDAKELERKKLNENKPEDIKEKKPVVPNKWGIVCVEESEDVNEDKEVAPGIQLAYTTEQQKTDEQEINESFVPETEESLDDLMKKLKSI